MTPFDLSTLSMDDFLPHLHTRFTIHLTNGQDYPLELVEVTPLGAALLPSGRVPFSLIFSNPDGAAYLAQRTYTLQHPAFADLNIFITPIGPHNTAMRYQAVFS